MTEQIAEIPLTDAALHNIIMTAKDRIPGGEAAQAKFALGLYITVLRIQKSRRILSAEIEGIMEEVAGGLGLVIPVQPVEAPQSTKVEDSIASAEQIFNEMIAKVQDKTQGNFPKQGLVSTTQITPSVAEESNWELVRATRAYYYSLRSRISFPFRKLLTEADTLGAAMSLSRRNYDIGGPQINDDRSQMTIKRADLVVYAHLGYISQLALLRARNQRGMEINNQGEAGGKSNLVFLSGYPRQSEGSDHEKRGFALGDNREGRERFADRLETYLKIRNALVGVLPLNR